MLNASIKAAIYPLLVTAVVAQSARLVHDFAPGVAVRNGLPQASRALSGGRNPTSGFVRAGSSWFFTAQTDASGRELWKTDGTTAGTQLVAEIGLGKISGNVGNLCAVGSRVYFSASGATQGIELWVSDGTAAGTQQVSDILPGANSSIPAELTPLGANVVFVASGPRLGRELWSQRFDRDAPSDQRVLGFIDHAHAAVAKPSNDLVFALDESPDERVFLLCGRCVHRAFRAAIPRS